MFNFLKPQIITKTNTVIINELHKPKRFFIFANRYQYRYGDLDDFLYSHPDYNEQSIFVLFNLGLPLQWFESVSSFKRKWICFRLLNKGGHRGGYTYRNLELLNDFNFERFYYLHDSLTFCDVFFRLLEEYNIDISNLRHFGSMSKEHHLLNDKLKQLKKPYCTPQKISTGLWTYIYLKDRYPDSQFTLIGFNADISPQSHSPNTEQQYLLREMYFNKNLETFRCIDTTQ